MKRWIGVGLGLVLVVVVAVAVVWGNRDDDGNGGRELVTVRGVIGSEKQAFFDDPQVKAAFARHGLRVEVDVAGTRQIATSVDLGKYGFAFPSSVPAAEKIRQDRGRRGRTRRSTRRWPSRRSTRSWTCSPRRAWCGTRRRARYLISANTWK
ncbi:hypothetical protein [Thermocatellispora tengchongensis]|uniref:hypothetical protein n=1 Tax=Thermocatellispora tengchongensis TaxID=1073253 RepID=UPI003624D219